MKKIAVLMATALVATFAASSVWAQPAPLSRLRGTIEKVDGNMLTVKTKGGQTATIKLNDNPRITEGDKEIIRSTSAAAMLPAL